MTKLSDQMLEEIEARNRAFIAKQAEDDRVKEAEIQVAKAQAFAKEYFKRNEVKNG